MLIGVGVGTSWTIGNGRTIHAGNVGVTQLLKPTRAKLSLVLAESPIRTKLRDHEVTSGIFPQKICHAMRASVGANKPSGGICKVAGAVKESKARVEIFQWLGKNFHAACLARIGGHVLHHPRWVIGGTVDKVQAGAWNGKVNIGIYFSKLHLQAIANNFLLVPILRKLRE